MHPLLVSLFVVLMGTFAVSAQASDVSDLKASFPILQIKASSSSSLTVTAESPAEAFEQEQWADAAESLPGFSTVTQPGKPEIPFISRSLLIPPTGGVRLASVSVESRSTRSLRQVSGEFDQDALVETSLMADPEGWWPAESIILGEPAILRGNRIVTVTMFPEQVNLATGEVRRNESFDFRLDFNGPEVNPIVHPERPKPSIYINRILRSLVDNPPPERDDLQAGTYLYVVPDVDEALEILEPLFEWRRRQGHKVTVAAIQNNADFQVPLNVIRQAYNADSPVEFVTLVGDASPNNFLRIAAFSQQGDFGYTQLEGNDALSDIALGRLSVRTPEQLEIIVNKLVTYESDPFDGNEDWYLQGGVVAGSPINGVSEVFVAKYVRQELLNLNFSEVRSYYWTENGGDLNQGRQIDLLNTWFRWGMSVFHYRAFQYMNRLPMETVTDLQNRDGRWPAVLVISCETGNFVGRTADNEDGYTETFLRSEGGGIGAIGTATPNTNVKFNNLVAGGVWKGIYKEKLYAFGWGLNAGKAELWRAFSGLDNNYLSFLDWNNLMGDAGTHIWTGVPSHIEVSHIETLPVGASHLEIEVIDSDSGDAMADALVCIYKGEELHQTDYTDDAGVAHFSIEPGTLTEGEMLVTVTKHNVRPYLGTIDVAEPELYLGLGGWSITEDDGDGLPNPGEEGTIELTLANLGGENLEGTFELSATVEGFPWITLTPPVGESVEFDAELAPGEDVVLELPYAVDTSASDQQNVPIMLTITQGDIAWESGLQATISAPMLTIENIEIEGGQINPGDVRNIDFLIGNFGSKASDGFIATLVSREADLNVHIDQAGYDGLDIGDQQYCVGQPFRISTNNNIVPGRQFTLELQITFDDGTTGLVVGTITIGRPGERDPFGPDAYGYICFDSGDTSWAMAPDFDWLELDPRRERIDFQGDALALRDRGDNGDKSIAVPLPFPFQYYGAEFDTITVCTNGWAAFGNQAGLADFRNSHIGQALGPSAQLCVWWDNLAMPPLGNGVVEADTAGIFTHFDQDGGRFIIEWSKMRRLLENENYGATETFQVILYNQGAQPTPTGDGVITFQYLDVENEAQPAHNDVGYCTIGIGNLDDMGGLEYTYWGRYSPGARPVPNDQPHAITFSPTLQVSSGYIRGRVTDAETGSPISGALIRSNRRGLARSDQQGNYALDLAIGAGYQLTASAIGWNDSTVVDIEVSLDDTVRVNWALLHPEFIASVDTIETALLFGESRTHTVDITNSGNGPLRWSAEKHVEGEDGTIGVRRFSFQAARQAGENDLVGAVHAEDRFYVSGDNGGREPMIYVMSEQGGRLGSFLQPGVSLDPMPDLAWDGELLWGGGGRNVYGFDLEGQIHAQFIGPYAENKGIAWDPVRELLWVAGSLPNNGIYGLDRVGRVFTTLSPKGFHVRGLAFWEEDRDNFPLYMLHAVTDTLNNERAFVHKYSLAGRSDTMFVTEVTPPEGGLVGGMETSRDFGAYDWSLVILMNDPQNNRGGDRVDVYQLGIVTTWLSVQPAEGELAAGAEGELNIDLNTAGLDTGLVAGRIIITHNALQQRVEIPVTLSVRGLGVKDDAALLPKELAIRASWPSPFNAAFTVAYDLPTDGAANLAVYDMSGRLMSRLVAEHRRAGSHKATFDATIWPSGVYAVRLEVAGNIRTAKVVCLK